MQTVRELPVEAVVPNPDQPRKKFDRAALEELAASIVGNGLMQPIQVRLLPDGRFAIIAGERRWRAHKIAGLPTIRAIVAEVDDAQRDILAIIENLQRVDITPLQTGCELSLTHELHPAWADAADRTKDAWETMLAALARTLGDA